MKKMGLVFFLLLMCSSCSFFSPVKTEAEKNYVLYAIPCVKTAKSSHKTILVLPPESTSIFDTPDMAYSLSPCEIAFYAKNRWADTPANMLQPLIVESLQRTNCFHAVVGSSFTGLVHYALYTKIIKLEHDYWPCSSQVNVVVRFQIVDVAKNSILASKQFCILERAPQNNPKGGVIAANCAVAKILKMMVQFVSTYCHA